MPIIKLRRKQKGVNGQANQAASTEVGRMKLGDTLKTIKPIRSQKTGVMLPREGTFVRAVENMGRLLILVNFGAAGEEYLFPDEVTLEANKA